MFTRGNMTTGPKTGSEATTLYFKYDGWNRLAGLDASGDGDLFDAGDYRYSYDGLGRRITKFADTANDGTNAAGTTEEYFYNDDYQLVEVRVGTVASGVKTVDPDARERYVWDATYIDAPAMVEIDHNTDGTRDYRLWPTYDTNFNVTSLVTDAGKVVERYAYTPYGERIILNGARNYANTGADPDSASDWTVDTNGSDFGFVVGFQGLRNDAETGMWTHGGRYSNASVSFTQRDPIRSGSNLYELLASSPVNFVDPDGNAPRKAFEPTWEPAPLRGPNERASGLPHPDQPSGSRPLNNLPGGGNFAGAGFAYKAYTRPSTLFGFTSKIHDIGFAINGDLEWAMGSDYEDDEKAQSRRAKMDFIFVALNSVLRSGTISVPGDLNKPGFNLAARALEGLSRDGGLGGIGKFDTETRWWCRCDGFINPLNAGDRFDIYLWVPYDMLPKEHRPGKYVRTWEHDSTSKGSQRRRVKKWVPDYNRKATGELDAKYRFSVLGSQLFGSMWTALQSISDQSGGRECGH